jgi:hypothetical protein
MWALSGRAIYVMASIVARFGVDNGHQSDTCHDEVGLMGVTLLSSVHHVP